MYLLKMRFQDYWTYSIKVIQQSKKYSFPEPFQNDGPRLEAIIFHEDVNDDDFMLI